MVGDETNIAPVDPLSQQPWRLPKFGRSALIALCFVSVGPFIGWLTFVVGTTTLGVMTHGRLRVIQDAMTALGSAYVTGAVPAAVSGIIIAGWAVRSKPSLLISAVVAALCGGVYGFSLLPYMGFMPFVVIFAAISAVAGAVCTRLTRRLQ